jgi:hypothetical protein
MESVRVAICDGRAHGGLVAVSERKPPWLPQLASQELSLRSKPLDMQECRGPFVLLALYWTLSSDGRPPETLRESAALTGHLRRNLVGGLSSTAWEIMQDTPGLLTRAGRGESKEHASRQGRGKSRM